MPETPPRPGARRRGWRVLLVVLAVALVGLPLLGVAGVAAMFWYYGRDLQEIDEAALRGHRPPQVTRIYAADGETLIGELYTERRTTVRYEAIPSHVEDAFLAAEDADFYQHEGLDYLGILRALLANARAGELRQGASTITQQVVKNFILSPERTFERKVQELLLARRLEQVLSKQEILELYLNEIYLGHGRYGIEEASRFYFGRGVGDIDLGQAALLATLPKAPGARTPITDPAAAKGRQVYVLRQMAEKGFASPEEVARFVEAPLELVDPERSASTKVVPGAEEFVDEVRAVLESRYGEELPRLGASVITTVDLEVQRAARAGLRGGLIALDRRQNYGHGIKPARDANLQRARARGAGELPPGRVAPVVIEAAVRGGELAEGEGEAGARWPEDGFVGRVGEQRVFVRVPPESRYRDPKLAIEAQFPVGGITMARIIAGPGQSAEQALPGGVALAEIGSGPEAALLLARVSSGEVMAMVGGYDYARGDFNRALRAQRQPGSAFKPFVYGAALASGRFTGASLVSDSPEIYEKWRPTNYERDVYRGDIRVREALTHSVNTVAIKLLDEIGVPAAHEFARAAGIEAELAANLSIALGTSELTPADLLRGFLTLARGGRRGDLQFIREIRRGTEVLWRPPVAAEEADAALAAVSPEVAFVVTSLMTSVVEAGTGQRARALGVPVAGKTGTSAEARDAWFAGYTTELAGVAWVGFDTPRPLGRRESGGRAALPIWLAAMEAGNRVAPGGPFVPPASVVVRTIDTRSGLLAPIEADPGTTLEEFFVPGTEPTEVAPIGEAPAEDLLLDLYGGASVGGGEPAPELEAGEDVEPEDPGFGPVEAAPKPKEGDVGPGRGAAEPPGALPAVGE